MGSAGNTAADRCPRQSRERPGFVRLQRVSLIQIALVVIRISITAVVPHPIPGLVVQLVCVRPSDRGFSGRISADHPRT